MVGGAQVGSEQGERQANQQRTMIIKYYHNQIYKNIYQITMIKIVKKHDNYHVFRAYTMLIIRYL